MILRWLVKKNHVTEFEILEYMAKYELPAATYAATKRMLERRGEPVLQYAQDHVNWHDVPTETEPHDA